MFVPHPDHLRVRARISRWYLALVIAAVAVAALAIALTLLFTAVAGAAVPGPGDAAPVADGPAGTAVSLYLVVLNALVPLVGYVLNHYAPWASEQAKGLVQAVLPVGVAVLYQAVTPGDLGLNDATLFAALTAMGSALIAHLGYKAAAINVLLGAGSNRDGRPAVARAGLSGR